MFEDHAAEPGWLAGQIREKVGWFPASYAEPAVVKSTAPKQPSITTSPSTEPLESIKEEPGEKESELTNAGTFLGLWGVVWEGVNPPSGAGFQPAK